MEVKVEVEAAEVEAAEVEAAEVKAAEAEAAEAHGMSVRMQRAGVTMTPPPMPNKPAATPHAKPTCGGGGGG